MDWSHYRFRSLWRLPAPVDVVYGALERAEEYPRWWPQVRSVTRIDDTSGLVRIRATLPYTLTFTAREVRRDPLAGVLEISMAGDLEGWARWTLAAHGDGTLAAYEQVVVVRKALLRVLAVPGRPVFRLNHRLMMRGGRRGLVRALRAV
ncbi:MULTISPECIES: SRPBCC family protein [unclassified Streptomyces]|uniref:SRPBCC family protein n=1 Tax=unclassified Streptomyces TaxID=2593676 RepID=UPI000DD72E16|nr:MULTISPECIES: SRPBCC family protein [unclassified Streptomyces]QZZ26758.1 polyketide cyclase [Streptomyces sp. ST1015]